MRMNVVFPLPLGPRKPQISPVRTVRSIPSTAVKDPNRLVIPATSMATSAAIASGAEPNVDRLTRVDPEERVQTAAALWERIQALGRLQVKQASRFSLR